MNINDVYFGKNDYFFIDVCVKTSLSLHPPFSFTFGHSLNYREFFTYLWLEIWDILYTPNARWLAYYDLRILA
jgi:hypothetical protein